ncbi:phosphotransferase system protein, sugar-specific permease EIIA 1 domain protein [Candidatus Mycoplasma haematolamae str. Purdue]|uniref:Phosphotransferase system protein, sugar-specific permease EIIA 1 domain protein n=1 Tax=Mycoplasma haematolamae (strain Purdue) TaxID=1212765 RepID=I7B8P1_MYCHA|nr:PTS glucose transporter subunit IIA [Candidatus Mycoplasma haematolamae]AFO51590.1 phosphotransferase system protein, sugar-specific permease EIIA 1 domain protein [Candidatus Mycoplasma haematolamae str. Purdue]
MGFLDSLKDSIKKVVGGDKPAPTFEVIKIYSPMDGVIVDQKKIPDEGFSEGYMGIGLGIKPTSSCDVVSPVGGVLEVLFKTQHAYIVREPKHKVAVMLHIGINTVEIPLEKQAFKTTLQQGQEVSEKQLLCQVNLDVIKEHQKSEVTALLVQNENMEDKKVEVHKKDGEAVSQGELIMTVVKAPS